MKKRFGESHTLAIIGIAAVFTVTAAAGEPSLLKRRGEFRREMESNDPAIVARLRLDDPDAVIRRAAAFALYDKLGGGAFEELKRLGNDPDSSIRLIVVNCAIDAQTAEARAHLKQKSENDSDMRVRRQAAKSVWPFQRKVVLLKDDLTWDHEIVTVQTIRIADKGWRFTFDRQGDGHQKKFFATDFNDGGWAKIDRGYWENQGYPDYDGLAWYRIRFDMPQKPACNAVEIQFDGVDESAWVWLNGIYLGEHDIGPHGFNVPFRLSAMREIVWGGRNVLTVRVLDTKQGGGIHGSISVEILR